MPQAQQGPKNEAQQHGMCIATRSEVISARQPVKRPPWRIFSELFGTLDFCQLPEQMTVCARAQPGAELQLPAEHNASYCFSSRQHLQQSESRLLTKLCVRRKRHQSTTDTILQDVNKRSLGSHWTI